MNEHEEVDPTLIYDLAIVGRAEIAEKGLNFTEFKASMIKEFGEKISPFMDQIWKESNRLLEEDLAKEPVEEGAIEPGAKIGKIVSDPKICGGEPCIKGTRIPVHVILSHIAAGEDYSSVLKQFPRIQKEDIQSCLEYASYLATEKSVI